MQIVGGGGEESYHSSTWVAAPSRDVNLFPSLIAKAQIVCHQPWWEPIYQNQAFLETLKGTKNEMKKKGVYGTHQHGT